MYNELSCYKRDATPNDIQELIFIAMKYGLNGVSVPSYHFSNIKNFLTAGMTSSIPVDFPLGMSDIQVRTHGVLNAIHKGANSVDLVFNNYPLLAGKKDIEYDEINVVLGICVANDVTLRIMLEYSLYENDTFIRIGNELREIGIEYVFPATGHHLDSFDDNLAIGMELTKKAKLNIITNGNVFNKSQYNTALASGIFGVRLKSMESVKNILKPIGV